MPLKPLTHPSLATQHTAVRGHKWLSTVCWAAFAYNGFSLRMTWPTGSCSTSPERTEPCITSPGKELDWKPQVWFILDAYHFHTILKQKKNIRWTSKSRRSLVRPTIILKHNRNLTSMGLELEGTTKQVRKSPETEKPKLSLIAKLFYSTPNATVQPHPANRTFSISFDNSKPW